MKPTHLFFSCLAILATLTITIIGPISESGAADGDEFSRWFAPDGAPTSLGFRWRRVNFRSADKLESDFTIQFWNRSNSTVRVVYEVGPALTRGLSPGTPHRAYVDLAPNKSTYDVVRLYSFAKPTVTVVKYQTLK